MTPEQQRPQPATGLYRLALRAFPEGIREAYGAEMVATFAAGYEARRRLGGARSYAWKASLDAVRAGLRERWGGGGVRRRPPRNRLTRWGREGRDAMAREMGVDLRLGLRSLARAPVFTVAVLVVLALGIGANGAIFSAVEATLLSGLPYPDADRIVLLEMTESRTDRPGPARPFPWSWAKYELLAATPDLPVTALAGYASRDVTLTGRGDPVRIEVEVTTPGYLEVLGVSTIRGRYFSAEGAEPEREAVLSHALWQERFGAAADVVGREVTLNGEPMVVVGVAGPGFRGLTGAAEAWIPAASVPLIISPRLLEMSGAHWLQAIGRLAPGVTLESVRERMEAVAARVVETYPDTDPTTLYSGDARSLSEARRNPEAQRAVLVVSVAAGLLLLVACANLAALMLARGDERRREIGIRLALGAGRVRVIRSLLVESVLLSLGGGLAGLLVARWGVTGIAAAWPGDFRDGGWNLRFVDAAALSFDAGVVAYTLGLALLAGLLFGLGPALRLSRQPVGDAVKQGAGHSREDRGWRLGGRRLLVAAEIGLALVLLVGAGLMVSSLAGLLAVDRGFEEGNLLVFDYSLPRASAAAEEPTRFADRFLEGIRRLPGVVGATGGTAPLNGHPWIAGLQVGGDRRWEEGQWPGIGVHQVDEAYFETLGIPVLQGRGLSARDDEAAPPVVVVNETAAREFFPDATPLGQPLSATIALTSEDAPAEVVGVVGDVLYNQPEQGTMPELYVSYRQEETRGLTVLVRTRGEPFDVLPDIRAVAASLEPDLALFDVTTVADIAAGRVSDTRGIMGLLAAFAALALVLAATGVWGVVAYSVTRRTRELGIRIALGARAGEVVRLVLRQGLVTAGVGAVLGLLAALAASRLLSSMLYDVSASDPRVFAAGAALLLAVAALAGYLPARRATRVDPVEALRAE